MMTASSFSRRSSSLGRVSAIAVLAGFSSVGCLSAPEVVQPDPDPDPPVTECTVDADCGAMEICTHDGWCQAKNSDDPLDPRPEPETCDEPTACVVGEMQLENQTPTIVLLVDQSGSMDEDFGAPGETRWSVMRDTLTNPSTGVIAQLEDDVRFGLALYTSEGGGESCPIINDGTGFTSIELGNYGAIKDALDAASPVRDTPTGESLAVATDYLSAYPVDGPKVVILATDGNPDTCDDPDAHDEDTQSGVEAQVQSTFDAGIGTYVISVGDEISEGHVQKMANAGAGLPLEGGQQAPYFTAMDQDQLKAALDGIIAGVRSCTFKLDGEVDPATAADAVVKVDGELVEYGTDWKLNSSDEIQLVGAACDALKSGNHQVTAEFPCECDEPGKEVIR